MLSCQISQIHRGPSIPGPSSAETPGRPWTACGDVGSLRRERIPTQRRCWKSKSRIRRFWCRSAWNPSLGEFRENWIRRRNCGIIEALRWRNSKLPGMVLENVISEEFDVVFHVFVQCLCPIQHTKQETVRYFSPGGLVQHQPSQAPATFRSCGSQRKGLGEWHIRWIASGWIHPLRVWHHRGCYGGRSMIVGGVFYPEIATKCLSHGCHGLTWRYPSFGQTMTNRITWKWKCRWKMVDCPLRGLGLEGPKKGDRRKICRNRGGSEPFGGACDRCYWELPGAWQAVEIAPWHLVHPRLWDLANCLAWNGFSEDLEMILIDFIIHIYIYVYVLYIILYPPGFRRSCLFLVVFVGTFALAMIFLVFDSC